VLSGAGAQTRVHDNSITRNLQAGVRIQSSAVVETSILRNSIFRNGGLGIDIGPVGQTPNDPLDADNGANRLQNHPRITAVAFDGATTSIVAELDSTPLTTFEVQVFANNSVGGSGPQGEIYLASAALTTDGAGHGSAALSAPGNHTQLRATATDPAGNTSELSAVLANPGEALALRVGRGAGSELALTFTPACAATDHAVYVGVTPIAGAVAWSAVHCGLGISGAAGVDPGDPSSGSAFYFVVVGQGGAKEGSYGQDSAAAERAEAIGLGGCDLPRELMVSCP
jgi:hypothetical protein